MLFCRWNIFEGSMRSFYIVPACNNPSAEASEYYVATNKFVRETVNLNYTVISAILKQIIHHLDIHLKMIMEGI